MLYKYLRLEDVSILREVLQKSNEQNTAELLALIITCKGKPLLKSYKKIKQSSPKWVSDLVYNQIKSTTYWTFSESLECLKMILYQDGMKEAIEFAENYTGSSNFVRMVSQIIKKVRLEEIQKEYLNKILTMVEGSLWVPNQIHENTSLLDRPPNDVHPLFRWHADLSNMDQFECGNANKDISEILQMIGKPFPAIALYLTEIKTKYSELLVFLSTLPSKQKVYVRVVEILQRLKAHFYTSNRQTEWKNLLQVLKTRHKQKKKLQAMIVELVDELPVPNDDWLTHFQV